MKIFFSVQMLVVAVDAYWDVFLIIIDADYFYGIASILDA